MGRIRQDTCKFMPGPYIQRKSWTPFVYQGNVYDLGHLDEYLLTVVDTKNVPRILAVTFDDHCFTRSAVAGDDPDLVYSDSNRNPGYFCFERYQLSLGIGKHIEQATTGQVWSLLSESFAAVSVVDRLGNTTSYGIVFTLNRVTGLPIHLHMRVKTAYPVDKGRLDTFGSVRFRHLVTLRMQNKMPGRIFDRNRKVPTIL